MTLSELSDAVAAANTTWNGLSTALKGEFNAGLRAQLKAAFNNPQRDFFKLWWLRVTAAQVTAGNALLPPGVRVTARLGLDGLLYVNADLLTDCQPGETYQSAATALKARTLVRKQDNEWPAQPVGP